MLGMTHAGEHIATTSWDTLPCTAALMAAATLSNPCGGIGGSGSTLGVGSGCLLAVRGALLSADGPLPELLAGV